jgi:hypothetical protein
MADDDTDDRRFAQNCEVIRDYLSAAFADLPVETPDARLGGLIFRIPWLGLASLWFSDQFLQDTEPSETIALLQRENIAARMPRVVKGNMLGVTTDGIKELPEK